jgi:uncharacterized protein (DUF4415 family)
VVQKSALFQREEAIGEKGASMSKKKLTQATLSSDGKVMIKQPTGVLTEAKDKTDWKKLAAMSDEHIDYTDIPQLDEDFFKKATLKWPPAKKQLTIRVDVDVLKWLKAQGKGYQTRINRILRIAMEHQQHGRHQGSP